MVSLNLLNSASAVLVAIVANYTDHEFVQTIRATLNTIDCAICTVYCA